jgi:cobalamin biosynthesis Mg chelatase CobN
LSNDESSQDKSTVICNDSETMESEVKRSNKSGKCRSRNSKVDCSLDYGPDADGEQHVQGVPSSREEKVSSLKTVSSSSSVPLSVFLILIYAGLCVGWMFMYYLVF